MSFHGRSLRRLRSEFAPECQALEGRRLMAAGMGRALNAIRVREMVGADGTVQLYIAGTARNDSVQIDDSGTAEAGNITLTFGDGRTYTSNRAIDAIQFDGRRGNDQCVYNLTGDLMAGRTVIATLGAGQDRFLAHVDHAIRTTGVLGIEAYGGAGRDNLSIVQSGPTAAGTVVPFLQGDEGDDTLTYALTGDIAAGAVVAPGLTGGAGNDTLRLDTTGQVLGQLFHNYTLDGGAGKDKLAAQVRVLAGSSGKIGSDTSTNALVLGGAGNDSLDFVLVVESTKTTDSAGNDTTIVPSVFARAVGGDDRDAVRRTANVAGDVSNENDAIVS